LAVRSEASTLSELIGDIYDAALDPALWTRALDRACSFVGGSSAILHWRDVARESSAALHLFNNDPHYTRLYFEKYWSMNPVFPAATFVESGIIYTPSEMVPQAELVETRFYREWMKPQGIVGCVATNLEKGAASSIVLTIRRHEGHGMVDGEMRYRAALIVPHFQRAAAIGRLFDQSKATQAVLTETLENVETGLFLVGPNGHIVFANGPGLVILDEGTLLRARGNLLAAVAPEAHRMLRDTFVAAEGGDISVGRHGVSIPLSVSPHARWFAHVLPLTSGDRQRTAADALWLPLRHARDGRSKTRHRRKHRPALPIPWRSPDRSFLLRDGSGRFRERGLPRRARLCSGLRRRGRHNRGRKPRDCREALPVFLRPASKNISDPGRLWGAQDAKRV